MKEQNQNLLPTQNTTYDVYVKDLNQFLAGRACNAESLRDYFIEVSQKYKPSTLSCIKSAVKKSIIKTFKNESNNVLFLSSLDMLFREFKTGKPDKKIYREKLLSSEEVNLLIDSTPVRISYIIKTLFLTGLRVSELINIKLKDCKIDNEIVYISIIGKGLKQRRVMIELKLYNEILKAFKSRFYLFERFSSGKYSRNYIWREIKQNGSRVLNKSISPHSFRHSFTTHMIINKNKSVKAVSLYLGHSDCNITNSMYVNAELQVDDLF